MGPRMPTATSAHPGSSPVVVGRALSLLDLVLVARGRQPAVLDETAAAEMARTRAQLEAAVAAGQTIYGVNTGFGALSETRIPSDRLEELQRNLLRSHAVGVGPALSEEVVRGLLLLRAHTLALGASGVRPAVSEVLLELLDKGVVPIVPAQGSVGASGDLAPLAHLALPLIGEGEAIVAGQRLSGAAALAAVGMSPFALGPKEGLSLINGTQVTTAITALALVDAAEVMLAADIIGALSLDAHLGTSRITDPRIHAGKPHPGQRRTAELLAELVTGSELMRSHVNCGRVQDAYSLRCMPQVHGSVRHALHYARRCVEIEINSFTDNPLVLPREDGGFDVVSGGNFHASTVALPADHLTAAMTTLATISERRLDRFMNPDSSRDLPAFLADDPGLESGLMMAQVTASALASECKAMSFPAAVDTIPTSAGKEDHVSMGPIAARKLRAVVDNVARVLAIEAITSARAVDLRGLRSSPRLQRVHEAIRTHVPPHQGDRAWSRDIEALATAILHGELRHAAELNHELDWRDA